MIFNRVRDAREWEWEEIPGFRRRIPWLYVEDGCFLRAEMMVEKLRDWKYPIPDQVMVFGDLQGVSKYETVNWWFHVAPVFRVGAKAYVLDPSIEPKRPLELQEWVLRMSPSLEDVSGVFCRSNGVDPYQECELTSSNEDQEVAAGERQRYLEMEWNLMQTILGISPELILGEAPPWVGSES
jgi:hypothetical protein